MPFTTRASPPQDPRSRDNAVVVYQGPSLLTGDPIAAVLTGFTQPSQNTKTGPVIQAYILRTDMDPVTAIDTGEDRAVCGTCSLRGQGRHGRGCYVTYWQGPLNTWRLLPHRPIVDPWIVADRLRGRHVRLAAYGDPAAVPTLVWARLLHRAGGWMGYTQRWETCDPGLRFYAMASVRTAEEARRAQALGWRTYRIRSSVRDRVQPGEAVCPASKEAGHKVTCIECQLCLGASVGGRKTNVVIAAHGKPGNLKAFHRSGRVGGDEARTSPGVVDGLTIIPLRVV